MDNLVDPESFGRRLEHVQVHAVLLGHGLSLVTTSPAPTVVLRNEAFPDGQLSSGQGRSPSLLPQHLSFPPVL